MHPDGKSVFLNIRKCSIPLFGKCRSKKPMLTCDYIVERIDGDYALLQRIDMPEEELKTVARELLPPEIVEGSKLHYEWMQYSLI